MNWYDEYMKYISSTEGQKETKEYFEKIKKQDQIKLKQLERFHEKGKEFHIAFIEKEITKNSYDEYIDRYYLKYTEPPCDLYFFLFDYALRYGRQCNKKEWKKYGNMFTDNLFYLYGYYFNLMNGQGRVIQITKKEE